jgi:protein-tyrosine-phosphatase
MLGELGIDASDHVPHQLEDGDLAWADVVIAACEGVCPVVAGKRYEDWRIPDPYGLSVEQVRAIRNEIAHRVNGLAASLDD